LVSIKIILTACFFTFFFFRNLPLD
jgi:hypothetical protein